eukprot:TRINITY_DN13669_c0_g1_i2.p3 TRINITY_DN13669_c0_g1~~TRINITY_DN13669_c0_g1_i2.p3  ORF type:complete len:137 (-),score=7.31 TRINITY_DN13669_c0_g1_i2:220-630(-)
MFTLRVAGLLLCGGRGNVLHFREVILIPPGWPRLSPANRLLRSSPAASLLLPSTSFRHALANFQDRSVDIAEVWTGQGGASERPLRRPATQQVPQKKRAGSVLRQHDWKQPIWRRLDRRIGRLSCRALILNVCYLP